LGSRNHRTRSGVLEHEGEPFGRELGIERHERRASLQDTEEGHHGLG
jgi:hypothetical protein